MERLILIAAALLAFHLFAVDDGVYEAGADGLPGTRIKLNITRGHIRSQSNANDRWTAFVCYSQKDALEGNKYTVVLNGTARKVGSWGKSGDAENHFSLELKSSDVDAAKKLFGFEPLKRWHNGFKIDGSFSTDKAAYTPGEKITITLTLRNVGDAPFYFRVGGRNRGPRDDQFSFLCEGPEGSVPSKRAMNFGGLSTVRTIEPGKEYTQEVDLAGWFDLTKPGYYMLKGSYYLEIHDQWDDPHFGIWEDYLTRAFHVEIKEKQ